AGHTLYEASANRVGSVHEYDRDGASPLLHRRNRHAADAYDDVWRKRDQLRSVARQMVEIASNVSDFDLEIVANRPTQLLQCLRKNLGSRFWHRIVARKDVENADDARALARLGLRCH